MTLTILIENYESDQPIVLQETHPFADYDVDLTAPGGNPASSTAAGARAKAAVDAGNALKVATFELTRGETAERDYPLYQWFDLVQIGEYQVRVSKPQWADADRALAAPPITFTVI